MSKQVRSQYTLEFKQEAVRLVEGGQRLAMAARSLGIAGNQIGKYMPRPCLSPLIRRFHDYLHINKAIGNEHLVSG